MVRNVLVGRKGLRNMQTGRSHLAFSIWHLRCSIGQLSCPLGPFLIPGTADHHIRRSAGQ